MTIAEFDRVDFEHKKELLSKCCGSSAWVLKMLHAPFAEDLVDLEETAEEKWYECSEADWLEAFTHHPKIGDVDSLKEKFSNTVAWASKEQGEVEKATETVLLQLAEHNEKYEQKFGYIFIVCATGKSAEEMLELLQSRLPNNPSDEIKIAAEEQLRITKLRLEKLFL